MVNKVDSIKKACKHDYKNAIQIGNVDYICPLCKKLLDPLEWYLITHFNTIDVGETDD